MSDPRRYQALVVAAGLEMYAKYKMQPNRSWTPTRMLQTAASITGKTFKRGQYTDAAVALREWASLT